MHGPAAAGEAEAATESLFTGTIGPPAPGPAGGPPRRPTPWPTSAPAPGRSWTCWSRWACVRANARRVNSCPRGACPSTGRRSGRVTHSLPVRCCTAGWPPSAGGRSPGFSGSGSEPARWSDPVSCALSTRLGNRRVTGLRWPESSHDRHPSDPNRPRHPRRSLSPVRRPGGSAPCPRPPAAGRRAPVGDDQCRPVLLRQHQQPVEETGMTRARWIVGRRPV